MPDVDATKDFSALIDAPDRTDFPSGGFTNCAKDIRRRFAQCRGFSKCAGYRILGGKPLLSSFPLLLLMTQLGEISAQLVELIKQFGTVFVRHYRRFAGRVISFNGDRNDNG